jgi:hypothetical protein
MALDPDIGDQGRLSPRTWSARSHRAWISKSSIRRTEPYALESIIDGDCETCVSQQITNQPKEPSVNQTSVWNALSLSSSNGETPQQRADRLLAAYRRERQTKAYSAGILRPHMKLTKGLERPVIGGSAC